MNNNTMPDNNTNTNNNDNNNIITTTFFVKVNPYHLLLSLLQKSIAWTKITHHAGATNCSF